MAPGKKPASVAPRRNRTTEKEVSLLVNSIMLATMPHVTMMRAIHLRAPYLCKARLLGNSNRA